MDLSEKAGNLCILGSVPAFPVQYLDEMMDLSEKKGKPVARRTHKVYSKVEELYQQVSSTSRWRSNTSRWTSSTSM